MDDGGKDWSLAYEQGKTPWDLRRVTPPLQALAAAGELTRLGLPPGARVAVPGCGRGHDLRVFAEAGMAVTGFDVVPAAVEEARQLLALNRVPGRILCRDVLGLLPEFEDAFELVYDYTCFCSFPPWLRSEYGRIVAGMLRPGGVFLHLTWPMVESRDPRKGPPFRILSEDLDATLGTVLTLERRFGAQDSDPERAGYEDWFLWRK